MYCHACLVDKMTTSVERGTQVTCDSCGKAMGEAPGQNKNLRGDAAAAASSSSFDPPAAKRPRQNLPYFGGNLAADSQFSQNRFTPMTVSSPASSTNQQYLRPKHYSSPIPAFGFQQPNSLIGPFQNRALNPLLPNPLSLPSQTSSMGSMYTPTSIINQSMKSLLSTSNASYVMRNVFISNSLIEPKEEVFVETTCAICWNRLKVSSVQIKCCKKIFCRKCLEISLKVKPRCPSCNQVFGSEDIFNYFTEMKIPEPIPISDLEITRLREQKESKNHVRRTLSVCFGDYIEKCKFEMSSIQRKMDAAVQDKKFIDGDYVRECSLYGGKISAVSSSNSTASSGMMPSMEDPISLEKDERLKSHFDAFCSNYYDTFSKNTIFSNEEPNNISQNRINLFMDFSEGVTKYGTIEKVANLNYYRKPDMPLNTNISSLEFDTTGEQFVVAGITQEIKIFNFNNFLENPKKCHTPLTVLPCQATISNISWNPVKNEILASSDYDGQVSLWDIEAGQVVRNFQEHEKRCWTVNFNNVDPKIMASGSDDAKVKIWNTNCERAMANIDAKTDVFCVNFSPTERNHLVFGSADHGVHLYDIRNVIRPVIIFKEHEKAVSYVRFINPTTIVSASTDNSLRVWDTVEERCVNVLKGHTNEKNFVGLSSNGDHILCGSENSRAFLYYKGLSDPIAFYTVSGDENKNDEDAEGFISSVCWKKGTDYALAANSHGRVHLLHVK